MLRRAGSRSSAQEIWLENIFELLQTFRACASVEFIARRLGLEIVYADLGDNVSGLLISKGKSTTIAVQKGDPENRQRFTIAHELVRMPRR